MIRLSDGMLLARTKLRTRRIRLTILIVTMSLLFSGLVMVANIGSGTISSLRSFGKEGYGNRYLVRSNPVTYQPYDNKKAIELAKPKQEALIAQKTALAKKLGITYDPKTDTTLYYSNQQTGPAPTDVEPMLTTSPLALAILQEQNLSIPGVAFSAYTTRAKAAGATNTYRSSGGMGGTFSGTNVRVLVDGKEDYSDKQEPLKYGPDTTAGVKSIETLGWNQMSAGLLQPFMLDGQSPTVGNDGSIPVVTPYSAAEQILKLSKLPVTATTKQRLDRLAQVRQQIAGKTAILCYRNEASTALLQQAIQQQAEINNNKKNKDYQMPALLYNLPTKPCGEVTIKSDKRSAEEKAAEKNQKQFDATFNLKPEPAQGIVTLRIIGISPDLDVGSTSISAGGILSSILGSNLGTGWFSPVEVFEKGSIATQAQGGQIAEQPMLQQTYYAEFTDLAAAKAFINQTDCYTAGTPPGDGSKNPANYNPTVTAESCASRSKPFITTPYGNNAGAIDEFQSAIWKVLRFVLLGVVVVATLVMMGTFGKVIADSRRETAVFRSLGASRLAVSQIYLTYTFFVCCFVAVMALLVGSIGAEIVNSKFSPGLSVTAVVTYNAHDIHKQFRLSGYNAGYLLLIVGLIFLAALLSAVIPLVLNMRRNPIRDMRDE